MLSRIRAALRRVWRPRRRRTGEHGFYDQAEARRYRAHQVGEIARGQSYQPPEGPTAIEGAEPSAGGARVGPRFTSRAPAVPTLPALEQGHSPEMG